MNKTINSNNGIAWFVRSQIIRLGFISFGLGFVILMLFFIYTYVSVSAYKNTYLEDTMEYDKIKNRQLDSLRNLKQDTTEAIKLFEYIDYLGVQELNRKVERNFYYGIAFLLLSELIIIPGFYYFKKKIQFHCYSCYKIILVKNIKNLQCPVCDTKNQSLLTLMNGCETCKIKIKYITCPHCSKELNLFKEYDDKKIKQKIHAS